MTAIDAYWTGTDNLVGEHSSMAEVERLLTVAQGHILSRRSSSPSSACKPASDWRTRRAASIGIEEVVPQQISDPQRQPRRLIAPVMQLMPARPAGHAGLLQRTGEQSRTVADPHRVPRPVRSVGEATRRLRQRPTTKAPATSRTIDFTRNGDTLDFVIKHVGPIGPVPASTGQDSANGWTLSHVSLDFCWLTNISMPINGVCVLSRVRLLIEDDQGRKLRSHRRPGVRRHAGRRPRRRRREPLPPAARPGPHVHDQPATRRTRGGDLHARIFAGPLGTLGCGRRRAGRDVRPETSCASPTVSREVSIESNDTNKQVAVRYAVERHRRVPQRRPRRSPHRQGRRSHAEDVETRSRPSTSSRRNPSTPSSSSWRPPDAAASGAERFQDVQDRWPTPEVVHGRAPGRNWDRTACSRGNSNLPADHPDAFHRHV